MIKEQQEKLKNFLRDSGVDENIAQDVIDSGYIFWNFLTSFESEKTESKIMDLYYGSKQFTGVLDAD